MENEDYFFGIIDDALILGDLFYGDGNSQGGQIK